MNADNKYTVYDVSDALASGIEYLGSKRKGWLTPGTGWLTLGGPEGMRILFKQGRPGTGENWAEKVTCALAQMLYLPVPDYYLARLKDDLCVFSLNFLEKGEELTLGHELIEGFDKEQKFKNTKHTLSEILKALQQNNVQLPCLPEHPEIKKVFDLFAGYLCFDAWIGNTDRHAENWGIITKANHVKVLAPTFDHASSLGRNESDEKRVKRLATKDQGFNVRAYAKGAVTPIFDDHGCAFDTISVVKACKEYAPEAVRYWIKRIGNIRDEWILSVFHRIPEEFISEPAKDFAMAILTENVKRLRELAND